MFNTKLSARAFLLVIVALIAAVAQPAEAGWKHRKKHMWKPCSDGWWARVREGKKVSDDNRAGAVLRCLLHNCGRELKDCAHDSTCRMTTRCLRDCRDEGRECALDCLKKYDGFESDEVKALGKCGISNECMRQS
jgi:hypothetical protein